MSKQFKILIIVLFAVIIAAGITIYFINKKDVEKKESGLGFRLDSSTISALVKAFA